MNHSHRIPRPSQTMSIINQYYSDNLDTALRLEIEIEEILSEFDGAKDWHEGALVHHLADARARQAHCITQAAFNLSTLETLRQQNGMGPGVMARVIQQSNFNQKKET